MTTEAHARIETVKVKVGELFPLAFHDEVLGQEATTARDDNGLIVPAVALTILRRGL